VNDACNKIYAGEECLAFSVLCDSTNIVYIFDSESGYLRTGDLQLDDAKIG
jgi:hypothetical protein